MRDPKNQDPQDQGEDDEELSPRDRQDIADYGTVTDPRTGITSYLH